MKKINKIGMVIAAVLICFAACKNPITDIWCEDSKKEDNGINNSNNNTGNKNVITVTGLSAQNRTYNGATDVIITGTPVLNGKANGDDLSIVKGTAAFADANAGNKKAVIFSGWSLGGSDASKYTLQMPNLTADISKADPVSKWPLGLGGAFGKMLVEITLPGSGVSVTKGIFKWENPYTQLNTKGKQTYKLIFTPDDTVKLQHRVERCGDYCYR